MNNIQQPNASYPSIPTQNSGLATASLVCGITSLLFSIFTGIPAIICGHKALSKIKKSQGLLGGSGMAIAGLVLGYISIALTLIIAVLAAMATPVIMKQQKKANMITATNNAKQLFMFLVEYDSDNKKFPSDLAKLVDEGYTSEESYGYISQAGKQGEWIYFSGQSTNDDSDNILIASPKPIDGKRVVLKIDGSAHQVREADYQAALRAQKDR